MSKKRPFRRLFDEVRDSLLPELRRSAVVIHIGPEIGSADVKASLEIGYCLLMDKPLIVLALKGRTISQRLQRAADLVIEVDWNNLEDRQRAVDLATTWMKENT